MPFHRSAGSASAAGVGSGFRLARRQRDHIVVARGAGRFARRIGVVGRPLAPGALAQHAAQPQENEHCEREEDDGVDVEQVAHALGLWARHSCAIVALDAALAALTYVTTRAVPRFNGASAHPAPLFRMLDDPGPCANNLGPTRYPDVVVEMGDFRAADAALRGNRHLHRGCAQARRPGRAGADYFDIACRYGGDPQRRIARRAAGPNRVRRAHHQPGRARRAGAS